MPDLVLFTLGFPYDGEESVLGPELHETAGFYRTIFVIPRRRGERLTGALPENAKVIDLGLDDLRARREKLRALASRSALRVLGTTLARPSNWAAYLRGWRAYLDILAGALIQRQRLAEWIAEQGLSQAIFYDYWFENATLALAILRAERRIDFCVSRAHRFDIFDWAWSEVAKVPFRDFKASQLDAIFAVSEQGAGYVRARLRRRLRRKVRVARLGVPLGQRPIGGEQEESVIVSCSSLSPRKQVHLIPEALAAVDRRLRWVHFGDGPERARVERAVSLVPPNVKCELLGRVDNDRVAEFYGSTSVSAFISTSSSEGVPVSMMEAQSFGIPIVAFEVGGIPEIVASRRLGTLLDPNATAGTLSEALEDAVTEGRFDHAEIQRAFRARYEAAQTFPAFARSLLRLSGYEAVPADARPGATVTTVLYNSAEVLGAYADALRPAVDSGAIRLIGVDNASPDDSAEVFRRLLPSATLISTGSNLGFGAGCNQSWQEVDTRYWLLLNPDVIASESDIEALVAWMDERPGVGLASPLLRRGDGASLTVARPHDSCLRPVVELMRLHKLVPEPWRSRWLLSGRESTPQEIAGWVPGAALIVRTEAARDVGLFNEELFMYGEDRELCWRMFRAGWGVGVCQDVTFVHAGSTSASATWSSDERVAREVRGHLKATGIMRGTRYARRFALVNGIVLWIEASDPRTSPSGRSELRGRGSAYLAAGLNMKSRLTPGASEP